MPWYGMHLIERVRNQAVETDRRQRALRHGELEPPSRTALIGEATPTLFVVVLWGAFAAALFCGVKGVREWDIIMTIAIVPLAMLVVGVVWGSQKSNFSSGLDAAIVTGAVAGALFFIASIW